MLTYIHALYEGAYTSSYIQSITMQVFYVDGKTCLQIFNKTSANWRLSYYLQLDTLVYLYSLNLYNYVIYVVSLNRLITEPSCYKTEFNVKTVYPSDLSAWPVFT